MKYTYEDRRAFFYLNNLLDALGDETRQKGEIMDWAEHMGIYKPIEKNLTESLIRLKKALKKLSEIPKELKNSSLERNLAFLAKLLKLSSKEISLLEASFLWKENKLFKILDRRYCVNGNDPTLFLNIREQESRRLLQWNGKLRYYGLIEKSRFDRDFRISTKTMEFLSSVFETEENMKKAWIGAPMKGNWRSKDFEYIPETDFAVNLLKNSQNQKGFNILLYGVPGTGKTSFAQMLVKETGRKLYTVGEDGDGEDKHNHRLQTMHIQQDVLENEKKACLLFDEAEDLFSSSQTKCDKVEINRLLENNEVPVIWTTNRIERMDPAFIRRFSLAIYFKKPPVEVQRKIWQKHLKENSLPHSYCQTMALAKEFSVPPSMISGAAKAASLVKGDLSTVRNHIEIMRQALNFGHKKPKEEVKREIFNPLLINADTDLATLTQQLKNLGRLNFSLCLYGAPGTGKSAYGRYLAEELKLKVLHKRASDLLGSYVGETEHNIARTFAEAKENKALLIFDEADSFLQDRKYAQRSWEVSSVNEMLTWMESHPYPFICTTNLMNRLDPASLRRFSFKVKYEFLNTAQVQTAFEHFFGVKVSNQDVASLAALTPGDFALVKNKAEILGVLKQPEKLKELLQAEQKVKTQHTTGQIGFCPR